MDSEPGLNLFMRNIWLYTFFSSKFVYQKSLKIEFVVKKRLLLFVSYFIYLFFRFYFDQIFISLVVSGEKVKVGNIRSIAVTQW